MLEENGKYVVSIDGEKVFEFTKEPLDKSIMERMDPKNWKCKCEFCRVSRRSRKEKIKFLSKRISRLKKAIKRLKDRGIRVADVGSENPLEYKMGCLFCELIHCCSLMQETREEK